MNLLVETPSTCQHLLRTENLREGRGWSTAGMRRGWEKQPKEEKVRGKLRAVLTYRMGGCREDGARLPLEVHKVQTRGDGHN